MRKYEVQMDNGDNAEADTIAAAMLAAETMAREGANDEGWGLLCDVLVGGDPCPWAWSAITEHLVEAETRDV